MDMPVDLVLVRHAESEGCLAHERSKVLYRRYTVPSGSGAELEVINLACSRCVCACGQHGDDSDWQNPDFRNRHTSRYRLSDKGRSQAQIAGQWVRSSSICFLPPHLLCPVPQGRSLSALPDGRHVGNCRSRRTCRRSSIGTSAASTCALWKRRRCSTLTTPIGTPVPCWLAHPYTP
jgi:hypothetical protein